VSLRAAIAASLPLCLLLTGCPLTDHYRLQEDSLGAQGGRAALTSSAGAGDDQSSAGFAEGGEFASNGGSGGEVESETAGRASGGSSSEACSVICNAERSCVAERCTGGWVSMAAPPALLVARSKAASVAMGKAAFIWGGLDNNGMALGNGAIYDPASDNWIYLPQDPGSPPPRINATAVWTGSGSNKVIVYGGTDATGGMVFRDGSVYDVANNMWTPLPASMSTSKRSAPFGYWDGTRAVFFGGLTATAAVVPGADRFDLKTWTTSTTGGDPGLLAFSAVAFDGTVMYLQGGVIEGVRQDKVFAYTSSTNTWASLTKGPSARTGGFGAWDGTHFVVWGGQDDAGMVADGKTLSGTSWSDMSSSKVLSARRIGAGRSGWAFQVGPGVVGMIAGQTSTSGSSDTLATDGATYAVQSGQWTPIPSWPSDEKHEYGVGVWTGEEFVIWGGRTQNVSTLTGERWAP